MDRNDPDRPRENTPPRRPPAPDAKDTDARETNPNPPHTTTGPITSPKFGSAGSGGAEYEPGPEKP